MPNKFTGFHIIASLFFLVISSISLFTPTPAMAATCNGTASRTVTSYSCDFLGFTYNCVGSSGVDADSCSWSGGDCRATLSTETCTSNATGCTITSIPVYAATGCFVTADPPPPPPPPPPPSCGDGICDTSTEACDVCVADCGTCPVVGGSCDGTCKYPQPGLDSCESFGMVPAGGTCDGGGFCCTTNPPPPTTCIPTCGSPAGCACTIGQSIGACSNNGASCTADADCGAGNTCEDGATCCDGLAASTSHRCNCEATCTLTTNVDKIVLQPGDTAPIRVKKITLDDGYGGSNVSIDYVSFTKLPGSASINVSPWRDYSSPYEGVVTGVVENGFTARVLVQASGISYRGVRTTCSETVRVIVANPSVPDCTLNLTPDPANLDYGDPATTFSAQITSLAAGRTVTSVDYYTDNPAVVHPGTNPATFNGVDTYSSLVTPVNVGTAQISAFATLDNGSQCFNTSDVTVTQAVCVQPSNLNVSGDTCIPSPTQDAATTWTWNAVPSATEYDITVYRNGLVETALQTVSASALGCSGGGTCSYDIDIDTVGNYTLRLVARGTCSDSAPITLPSPAYSISDCSYTISGGGVGEDEDNLAYLINGPDNFRYYLPGAPGINPGGNSRIVISGYPDTPIAADGSFTPITVSAGTYFVDLVLGDSINYFCAKPSSCRYSVTVGPDREPLGSGIVNESDLNYYVASAREPWIQIIGGDIHTNQDSLGGLDDAFSSEVPFSCVPPACEPYVILQDTSAPDPTDTSGVITLSSGDINFGSAVNIDQDGKDRFANTTVTLPKENYDYFYRLFEFTPSAVPDTINGNSVPPLLPGPVNDTNAYLTSGDFTVTAAWNVTGDRSIVIFIPGNLTISAPVNVDPGSFLAFVVSGNIIVDPTVGYPDPTTLDGNQNLEGIYIAGSNTPGTGIITIQASNFKFIGEGTFVAWGGFELERDYGNNDNNTNPSDLFRFRPDLITHAPAEFKRSAYIWQEVAP